MWLVRDLERPFFENRLTIAAITDLFTSLNEPKLTQNHLLSRLCRNVLKHLKQSVQISEAEVCLNIMFVAAWLYR